MMSTTHWLCSLYRPSAVREVAMRQHPITAVAVNAVNGIAAMTALAMTMIPIFTLPLVVLMGVLFGPLVCFIVSSIYPRIEQKVGAILGGKATLADLYRIFAWSFLPVGFAGMLFSLILAQLKNPGATTLIVASVPSIAIAGLAARNYCSNVAHAHQFSRTRSFASIIVTFILFVLLTAAVIILFRLLISYCAEEDIRIMFHI
jgi:hypothetical protein